MRPEDLPLHVARALVVVIVETRLPDCYATRMLRQGDQFLGRHIRLAAGIMGMRADGEKYGS